MTVTFLVAMPQCVAFLHLMVVGCAALSANSSMFVQEEMCDVEESIYRGCSKKVNEAPNIIDCAFQCWLDTECVGASLDAHGICLHHELCHTSVPCHGASKHRYMARYCVHGTWHTTTQSCVCRYGTFGERCNNYHTYCDGLISSGYSIGHYQVILDPLDDGANLVKVFCYVDPPLNYAVVQLMLNSGKLYPNRTWNEYVNGFSTDYENLWAGLRSIHVLGEIGVTNLFVVITFQQGNIHALYSTFVIGNRESGFSFSSVFSYASSQDGQSVGDCLSTLQGVPFSAWDRDEDGTMAGNCASQAGSGWWYTAGCNNPCNMLGWGLDNYDATPPHQRLSFLGVDVAADPSKIMRINVYLKK